MVSVSDDSLQDDFGRRLGDLRLSVTDRCNFRCLYCRPSEVAGLPRQEILSFDEIERLARIFVLLGIRKIRVTGGEPLVRRDLPLLLRRLALLKDRGLEELVLTSNGSLLAPLARTLRDAGVDRLNLSCDSLEAEGFRRLTGRNGLDLFMRGLEAAQHAGFQGIKVNCVVIRGLNDHEVVDFARFARQRDLAVRFIEFMPLDAAAEWGAERVVPAAEILARLRGEFELIPVPPRNPAETASRFSLAGAGEIGVISSVTAPFCERCNRIRLTADGHLRTCLFALQETDLRGLMRSGAEDPDLVQAIRCAVLTRERTHHVNEPGYIRPGRDMAGIGG